MLFNRFVKLGLLSNNVRIPSSFLDIQFLRGLRYEMKSFPGIHAYNHIPEAKQPRQRVSPFPLNWVHESVCRLQMCIYWGKTPVSGTDKSSLDMCVFVLVDGNHYRFIGCVEVCGCVYWKMQVTNINLVCVCLTCWHMLATTINLFMRAVMVCTCIYMQIWQK